MSKYVKPVRVDIRGQALQFQENNVTWTGLKPTYDGDKGILTLDMSFSEFKPDFDTTRQDYCQPKAFCKLAGDGKTCQSSLDKNNPLYGESQLICAGAADCDPTHPCRTEGQQCVGGFCTPGDRAQIAGKDVDCPLFPPVAGQKNVPFCIGVRVTLGNSSQFQADDMNHQPRACCFPEDKDWNVKLKGSGNDIAGTCSTTPIPDAQFCKAVVACDN